MVISEESKKIIEDAITDAEKNTRAEIHVHLCTKFWDPDFNESAQKIVDHYGLRKTEGRTAILIYVNLRRHGIVIWGDQAIHRKVGQGFWNEWISRFTEKAKKKDPFQSLAESIRELGLTLEKYFPVLPQDHNPNELSNTVSVS
jgi:uncharacterized membrane protein